MIQLTDKGHWAVEVTQDANTFIIKNRGEAFIETFSSTLVFFSDETRREWHYEPLPPGTWQYLFTTKGRTEEDARKVVGLGEFDKITKSNKYTVAECKVATFKVDDAAIALNFLLRSKGCDVKKNWAIIQKQTDNG